MANIGSLVSTLELNSSQFNRNLNQAQRNVRSFSARTNQHLAKMERTWKSLRRSVLNFRGAVGMAAGSAGLGYLIQRNIEAADKIAKTADAVNISTKALQRYRYIAERSGVDTKKLDQSFKKFSSRVSDLAGGTGPLINRLEGVNDQILKNIRNSKTQAEALNVVFQAMQNAENATERVRIATAAFGREQAASITNMAKNVNALKQRYRELNLEIEEKLLRNAESTKDAIDDVGLVIQRSFQKAILAVAPNIEKAASSMADWVASNEDFITQDIPNHINSMASAVSDFVNSKEFKLISEYWELMAGAAIGAKYGGLLGALVGAGAGGYYSAYKDLKELGAFSEEAQTKLEKLNAELEEHQGIVNRLLKAGPENWSPMHAEQFAESSKKAALLSAEMKEVIERQKQTEEATQDTTKATQDNAAATDNTAKSYKQFIPISEKVAKTLREQKEATEETTQSLALQSAELVMSEREYDKLQAKIDAGIDLQGEHADKIDKSVDSYHDLQLIIEGTEAATEAMQKGSSESLDKMEKDHQQTTTAIEHAWEEAYREMESAFGDIFYDAMTGQLDDFEDYWERIVKSMVRVWADAQGEMMARSVMNKSGLGATMSQQAQQRAGLSGEQGWMQQIFGGSDTFSTGGRTYTGSTYTPQKQANVGAESALQGVQQTNWSKYGSGTATAAMGAYSMFQNRENMNETKGMVQGAAIGTQIYPGVGTIVGAVGGAMLGGILGSGSNTPEVEFDPTGESARWRSSPDVESSEFDWITKADNMSGKHRPHLENYLDEFYYALDQKLNQDVNEAMKRAYKHKNINTNDVGFGAKYGVKEPESVAEMANHFTESMFEDIGEQFARGVEAATWTEEIEKTKKTGAVEQGGKVVYENVKTWTETVTKTQKEIEGVFEGFAAELASEKDFIKVFQDEGETFGDAWMQAWSTLQNTSDIVLERMEYHLDQLGSYKRAWQATQQEVQQVANLLGPAIQEGLNQSIETMDFADFKQGMADSLQQQMQQSLVQAAHQELQQSIIQDAFGEALDIQNLVKERMSGEIGLDEFRQRWEEGMQAIHDAIPEDKFNNLTATFEELGLAVNSTIEKINVSIDSLIQHASKSSQRKFAARTINQLNQQVAEDWAGTFGEEISPAAAPGKMQQLNEYFAKHTDLGDIDYEAIASETEYDVSDVKEIGRYVGMYQDKLEKLEKFQKSATDRTTTTTQTPTTTQPSGPSPEELAFQRWQTELGLQEQLYELTGDQNKLREVEAELRKIQLEGLSDSNKKLQKRIWTLQDEKEAAQDAFAVWQERLSLQEQYAELIGDTQLAEDVLYQQRKIQLEQLDESNRGLQQQIWLMQDVKDARRQYHSALQTEYRDLQEEQSGLEQELSDAKSTYISMLEDEQSELQSTADAMEQLTKSLSDYHSEILLGSESSLGIGQKAKFARSEFMDTASLAKMGDQEAMEALQSVSSEYLSAARAAGTGGDAFREIQKALNATEDVAQDELSEAERQLGTLEDQLKELRSAEDAVSSIEEAQSQYQSAKLELDRWNQEHDLTWYEQEIDRLDQIINGNLGVQQALENYQSALTSAIGSGYSDLESKFGSELNKLESEINKFESEKNKFKDEQDRSSSGGGASSGSSGSGSIDASEGSLGGAFSYGLQRPDGSWAVRSNNMSTLRTHIEKNPHVDYEIERFASGGTIYGPESGYSLPGAEFHGTEHITPDSQMADVKEQLAQAVTELKSLRKQIARMQEQNEDRNDLMEKWDNDGLLTVNE